MGKNRRSAGGTGGEPSPTEEPTQEAQKFTDEEWNKVSTAQEIADMLGWEFTETERGSYDFYDKEHNMHVFIDKTMLTNHFIDPNSTGEQKVNQNKYRGGQTQNIRDVLRAVQELPDKNKEATPYIIFRNWYATNTLGQHLMMYNKYTKEIYPGHAVIIPSSSFSNNPGHSIRRTLLHETDHALDFMMGTSTNLKSRDTNGISNKSSFMNAVKTDMAKTGEFSVSMNSKEYKLDSKTYYSECWADAASIVQLKQQGYGSEKVQLASGKMVTVDQWIDTFPTVYSETVNQLKLSDTTSFKRSGEFTGVGKYIPKNFKLNK